MPNSYYFVQCSEHRSYLMYENNNSKCIKWSWRYMALASVDSKSSKEDFFSPARYGMGHMGCRYHPCAAAWGQLSAAHTDLTSISSTEGKGDEAPSVPGFTQLFLWTRSSGSAVDQGRGGCFLPTHLQKSATFTQFPQPPHATLSQTLMSQLMSAVSLKTQNRYTIFEHLLQPFQTGRLLVARNTVSPLSSSQT